MISFLGYISFEKQKKEYNIREQIKEDVFMTETIQLPGCRLHVTNTNKFKNTVISMKFKNDLQKETSTLRSLLSMVLLGGTENLPSIKDLAIYLEEMYGANLSTNVSTKGKAQIIHLTASFVNEKFIVEKEGLFQKQLTLMNDILYHPYLVNGVFPDNIVNQKKRELQERLAAMKDDKYSYALDRTLDIMGKGQVLEVSGVGYEEDIATITAADLTNALNEMLQRDTIEIYAIGDFSDADIQSLKQAFQFSKRDNRFDAAWTFANIDGKYKEEVEIQDLTQSKYNMGFAINCDFLSSDHEAMTIFNGIFGAFSHSRLFKNVREKNSLCYYIQSNYDAFNGIMIVSCGIEADKEKAVKKIVLAQLQDIQAGHITDEELNITKMMFKNSLLKSQDEASSMIVMQYNRDLVNKQENIAEYAQKLLAVSKEDVIRVSQNIKLDTTFFLKGVQEDGN